MRKLPKKPREPYKGFSKEEQIFFEKLGRPVENYRAPAIPRPVIFDDKTKYKRSRNKKQLLKMIKEETI